jgi:serine/threonine-protein kinase
VAAPYAIKILKRAWETDPRAVEMIRREALAGRSVSHPHLISVLSGGTGSAPYYVVMPWLTGTTLAARLAQRKVLEVPEAVWIIRQVADALGALHAAGWMHGDVKPSNIFLSPEGHATLLDLGFARRTDRPAGAVERCLAGTGHYMAPEGFIPALGVDIRSDLYSLGATMHEMLAGRPPFSGPSAAELARQHREARPLRLEEVVCRLPSDAGAMLRQMLAKEPLRRPQTPREVVLRLVPVEIATLAQRWRSRSSLPA